jgi:hypothetical protein
LEPNPSVFFSLDPPFTIRMELNISPRHSSLTSPYGKSLAEIQLVY